MKLPNASELIVERDKVLGYLLNPLHRYGAVKERFSTPFGFRADDWQMLAESLREHGRGMRSFEHMRPVLVRAISWKEN